jgi:CBS domain-containing protein
MTTAREIMTGSPVIVDISTPIRDIARQLADNDIGSVIVCTPDRQLQGMVTDRDLAVGVLAAGLDPESTTAQDLVSGREVVTIGADDSVDEAIRTMKEHAVRRLPVIDGQQVIGMVSQADLATHGDEKQVGRLVEMISAAPDNTGQG